MPGTVVVARFSPVRPVLWLVVCVGLMVAMVAGLLAGGVAEDGGAALGALGALWVVALAFVLWRWVVPRLTRMSRSRWAAFAVDPYGIHLGAEPGKAPAFVPWHQVAAVVLREWRVGEDRKRRRAVGIALRTQDMAIGVVQGSPRDLDAQVSVLLPMKDWHIDEGALRTAVASVAPGVPAFRHDRG
ncbi:hypothetical protein [Actinophytocola glycyrrhizae]|uniref:DUF3093 family protein n=1 Tax=Actinophytocola glycyrrhizae TaxID=2044873 RepID=A0ABV9S9Y6_9PSEU